MSLLSIVQDALAEAGGTNIPGTIINNADPVAVKALAMMQGIGRDLKRQYNWPALKTTYTFSTVASTPGYALPSDFQRFSSITQWDRTSHWPLMGAATDSFWQLLQSGSVTYGSRFWFRIEGSNFVLAPTPTDVRTIAFDYYKNTWVYDSAGTTAKEKYTADTDYPRFMPNKGSEDMIRLGLLYKWKAANGMPYNEDKANYLAAIDADTWDAAPQPLIDVTGIGQSGLSKGIVPDTGVGA